MYSEGLLPGGCGAESQTPEKVKMKSFPTRAKHTRIKTRVFQSREQTMDSDPLPVVIPGANTGEPPRKEPMTELDEVAPSWRPHGISVLLAVSDENAEAACWDCEVVGWAAERASGTANATCRRGCGCSLQRAQARKEYHTSNGLQQDFVPVTAPLACIRGLSQGWVFLSWWLETIRCGLCVLFSFPHLRSSFLLANLSSSCKVLHATGRDKPTSKCLIDGGYRGLTPESSLNAPRKRGSLSLTAAESAFFFFS